MLQTFIHYSSQKNLKPVIVIDQINHVLVKEAKRVDIQNSITVKILLDIAQKTDAKFILSASANNHGYLFNPGLRIQKRLYSRRNYDYIGQKQPLLSHDDKVKLCQLLGHKPCAHA